MFPLWPLISSLSSTNPEDPCMRQGSGRRLGTSIDLRSNNYISAMERLSTRSWLLWPMNTSSHPRKLAILFLLISHPLSSSMAFILMQFLSLICASARSFISESQYKIQFRRWKLRKNRVGGVPPPQKVGLASGSTNVEPSGIPDSRLNSTETQQMGAGEWDSPSMCE